MLPRNYISLAIIGLYILIITLRKYISGNIIRNFEYQTL